MGYVNHDYIELTFRKDKFTIDDWIYYIDWEKQYNENQHVKSLSGFNPHFNIYFGCHPIIDDDSGSIKIYYAYSKLIKRRYN